ncbi:MAG: hypothetical protein AAGG53_14495, partial [Cyanobacteria bacterium P01_H01_bin.152]
LAVSAVALSSLVPGGPIETRSFAHIHPILLGSFNTFLTTLSILSLLLVYFVLQSQRWALGAAAVCGLSYFLVYGLDLAQVFPVSPDVMPATLLNIEVLGTVLSVPLTLLAGQAARQHTQPSRDTLSYASEGTAIALPNPGQIVTRKRLGFALGLGLLAMSIITFATRSAMGL